MPLSTSAEMTPEASTSVRPTTKSGTFVRGALGDLSTDAVAVGSGIPFAGVDDFDLDIGV